MAAVAALYGGGKDHTENTSSPLSAEHVTVIIVDPGHHFRPGYTCMWPCALRKGKEAMDRGCLPILSKCEPLDVAAVGGSYRPSRLPSSENSSVFSKLGEKNSLSWMLVTTKSKLIVP